MLEQLASRSSLAPAHMDAAVARTPTQPFAYHVLHWPPCCVGAFPCRVIAHPICVALMLHPLLHALAVHILTTARLAPRQVLELRAVQGVVADGTQVICSDVAPGCFVATGHRCRALCCLAAAAKSAA